MLSPGDGDGDGENVRALLRKGAGGRRLPWPLVDLQNTGQKLWDKGKRPRSEQVTDQQES